MTAGWVFKAVQAGVIGLMVYIIIKVFADRFRKQAEDRTGKRRGPFMDELKGKLRKRRSDMRKDAEWVEVNGGVRNKRMSSSGDDGVPQEEAHRRF